MNQKSMRIDFDKAKENGFRFVTYSDDGQEQEAELSSYDIGVYAGILNSYYQEKFDDDMALVHSALLGDSSNRKCISIERICLEMGWLAVQTANALVRESVVLSIKKMMGVSVLFKNARINSFSKLLPVSYYVIGTKEGICISSNCDPFMPDLCMFLEDKNEVDRIMESYSEQIMTAALKNEQVMFNGSEVTK